MKKLENLTEEFTSAKQKLRETRNRLLGIHKVLMELQREIYESQHGGITQTQLLQLLFVDANFLWLRSISTLVSKVDEAFDQADGIGREQVANFEREIEELFDRSVLNAEFKSKYEILRTLKPESIPEREEFLRENLASKEV